VTVAFIDDHRKIFGVEPICWVLPIGPDVLWAGGAMGSGSAIGAGAARRGTPRDHSADLTSGSRWSGKVSVKRCHVQHLMRELGVAGAVRDRAWVTTTWSNRPADLGPAFHRHSSK
jgi:hypothetical protein